MRKFYGLARFARPGQRQGYRAVRAPDACPGRLDDAAVELNREPVVLPFVRELPAGALGERAEFVAAELVGMLGVQRFAEGEMEALARNPYVLLGEAHQMHFDAARHWIVERVVAEARRLEVGVQLAVEAVEEIEVEGCGDAGRVIVGGVQPLGILLEIESDEQAARRAGQVTKAREQRRRRVGREVTDAGAGVVDE